MPSSREPMWFCHECHAEMRPLMVPDPHCASCNGTFVEKIESEQDDPRAFQEAGPVWDDGTPPDGLSNEWFANLMQLLSNPEPGSRTSPASSLPNQPPNTTSGGGSNGSGLRFEFSRTGPGGATRSFVIGGPTVLGGPRAGRGGGENNIAGTLMAQYLLSMLNHRAGSQEDPFGGLLGVGPEDGRWGDYVFNQEALDQIVTQLMENSNSSRPAPATEEILNKLDRQVLEEGSPLLERDCAVCKEQFSLQTEDPDEQVVVTLPCKHPFHQGCIIPWLKTSGTCPVCRHQLVPQPSHDHPPSSRPGSPRGNPGSPQPGSSSNTQASGTSGTAGNHSNAGHGGGIFGPLFHMLSGGHGHGHNRNGNTDSSTGHPTSPSRNNSHHDDVPGGWVD